jgi:hypothetical protein
MLKKLPNKIRHSANIIKQEKLNLVISVKKSSSQNTLAFSEIVLA